MRYCFGFRLLASVLVGTLISAGCRPRAEKQESISQSETKPATDSGTWSKQLSSQATLSDEQTALINKVEEGFRKLMDEGGYKSFRYVGGQWKPFSVADVQNDASLKDRTMIVSPFINGKQVSYEYAFKSSGKIYSVDIITRTYGGDKKNRELDRMVIKFDPNSDPAESKLALQQSVNNLALNVDRYLNGGKAGEDDGFALAGGGASKITACVSAVVIGLAIAGVVYFFTRGLTDHGIPYLKADGFTHILLGLIGTVITGLLFIGQGFTVYNTCLASK